MKKWLVIALFSLTFLQCGDAPTAPIQDDEQLIIYFRQLSATSFSLFIATRESYGCDPKVATKFSARDRMVSFLVEGIVKGDDSCQQQAASSERIVSAYNLNALTVELMYRKSRNTFELVRNNSRSDWYLTSESTQSKSRIVIL